VKQTIFFLTKGYLNLIIIPEINIYPPILMGSIMITSDSINNSGIFTPWNLLGRESKRFNYLNSSWAPFFRDNVLPILPIEKLTPLYCKTNGRPTKDLYTLCGLAVLQQHFDLSDIEACRALSFDLMFQTALNITDPNDRTSCISPRTLRDFRHKLIDLNMASDIFAAATSEMLKCTDISLEKQRLDSVHIFSNMRKLSRLGLFIKTVGGFLKNLKHNHRDLFNDSDQETAGRHMSSETRSENYFGLKKPSETKRTLEEAAQFLFSLVSKFKDNPAVNVMSSFRHLVRLLSEQCVVIQDTAENGESAVELKEPKNIPSNSLQNPSDPDATYCGHKGQGYQVQLMEAYSDTRDDEDPEPALKVITHVALEQAHESDAHALMPAIESAINNGMAPKQVVADTAYGSDDNVTAAAESGVEVISPVAGKDSEGEIKLSDFQFDESSSQVTACPNGQKSWYVNCSETNGSIEAGFDTAICNKCPFCSGCPVVISGEQARLNYTPKKLRLSERRAFERTEGFKNIYSMRSGIEATNSYLDRTTRIKHSRYRGFRALQFSIIFKVLGANIARIARYRAVSRS
jgi:hypothetical protein